MSAMIAQISCPPAAGVTPIISPALLFASEEERALGWSAFPEPQYVPRAFARAASILQAAPMLMASSRLACVRMRLQARIREAPLQESWAATFTRAATKALGSLAAASRPCSIAELDVHHVIPLAAAQSLERSLGPIDAAVLHAALHELCETEGADGLRVSVGLIMRGAGECDARKRFVLATLLARLPRTGGRVHGSRGRSMEAASGGGGEQWLAETAAVLARVSAGYTGLLSSALGMAASVAFGAAASSGAAPPAPAVTPESPQERVLRARVRLLLACEGVVEELKNDAIAAVFLEPTKAYFRAVGDATMEGDVDVHGANVYLSLLAACLGVRASRPPYTADRCVGVADVLAAGLVASASANAAAPRAGGGRALPATVEALPSLWSPSNGGGAWEAVSVPLAPPRRLGSREVRLGVRARQRASVFTWWTPEADAGSPAAQAVRAAEAPPGSLSPQESAHTATLAAYLEAFAAHFAGERFLRRLINRCTTGDDGLLADAQTLFADLCRLTASESGEGGGSAGGGGSSGGTASPEGGELPLHRRSALAAAYPTLRRVSWSPRQLARMQAADGDVRYWLWDLEGEGEGASEGCAALDCEAALLFFAAVGATKAPQQQQQQQMEQPGGLGAQDPTRVDAGSGAQGGAAPAPLPEWACRACTYVNPARARECEMCETSAAPGAAAAAGSGREAGELLPLELLARVTAAGDIRGGGTGREFVENLPAPFPGRTPWCKWMHPRVTSSWVHYDLRQPLAVRGYGLCAANDAPARDPQSWALMGLPELGGAWRTLHAVGPQPIAAGVGAGAGAGAGMLAIMEAIARGETPPPPSRDAAPFIFTQRWQWAWWELPASAERFTALRLQIHAVRQPGDGVQLAHWHVRVGVCA